MKILFLMRHTGYVRNFESAIKRLGENGHDVHLLFSRVHALHSKEKLQSLTSSPRITFSIHSKIDTVWYPLALRIRRIQNFLRYLDAPYAEAPKLKARAEKRVPSITRAICRRFFEGNTKRIWSFVRFLRRIEKAIPISPAVCRILNELKPEVVLLTPFVDLDGYQLDWAKGARKYAIPCALCVASWDNLTNKGLLQIVPDRVIVWNEFQKKELEELHRIDSAIVSVTGAQCYDAWFKMDTAETRDSFLARAGLPVGPYVLYLCSSPFICSREVEHVEKWLREMQNCPKLSGVSVLIRPHPQNCDQWESWDGKRFAVPTVVYPPAGANPIDAQTKNDYFNSLYHSFAVVGTNTSGLIEAGILKKPVLTVLTRKMSETQMGTLHFRYLVENGLLQVSDNLNTHFRMLESILEGRDEGIVKRAEFVKSFVRPLGLDREATPFFTKAVQEMSGIKPRRVSPDPLGRLLGLFLLPWALAIWWMSDKKS